MKDIPQKYIVIAGVIIVLIIIGIVVMGGKKTPPTSSSEKPTIPVEEVVIPTVDASVKVDIEALNKKREVSLTINGIPAGTTAIDYELSYLTKAQGTQGSIGNIAITSEDKEINRKITLGTCSSGSCVYHDVEGGIKVTLKFTGDYGEKLFEKEFEL